MGRRRLKGKSQETIVCNDCGKIIRMRIREDVIDHDTDGKEIREQYILCSHCNRRYTIIILDECMRAKIAERNTTNDLGRKIVLQREMKEYLHVLKQRYGRD